MAIVLFSEAESGCEEGVEEIEGGDKLRFSNGVLDIPYYLTLSGPFESLVSILKELSTTREKCEDKNLCLAIWNLNDPKDIRAHSFTQSTIL